MLAAVLAAWIACPPMCAPAPAPPPVRGPVFAVMEERVGATVEWGRAFAVLDAGEPGTLEPSISLGLRVRF